MEYLSIVVESLLIIGGVLFLATMWVILIGPMIKDIIHMRNEIKKLEQEIDEEIARFKDL